MFPHTGNLSDAFFAKLRVVAFMLFPLQPDAARWMLSVMMSESGIHPHVGNPEGCVGLIQFCQATAGRTLAEILAMSAEDQLDVVRAFYAPWSKHIESAANLYQANFLPGSFARGSSLGTVIVDSHGTGYGGQEANFYASNKLLDMNHDGKITVSDLQARLDSPQVAGDPRFVEALERLKEAPMPFGGPAAGVGTLLLVALIGYAAVQAYRSPATREALADAWHDVTHGVSSEFQAIRTRMRIPRGG